jgi:hypothetical protein
VVCNPDQFSKFETYTGKQVAAGDAVIELAE